ncbi:DNA glycosylase [Crassisporium funariophilum]|nr:DNA glycosylase [Crassisporium funariophilum]
MPKRRLTQSSDFEFDGSSFAGSSGDEDASYAPKLPGRKSSKAPTARKKAKVQRTDASSSSVTLDELDVNRHSHSRFLHIIESPVPIRLALLEWYKTVYHTRGMPWRKPYDPTLGAEERAQRAYEVWISEIMLQQTQVVTVIPYYNRWMEKFPNIHDLAGATIDQVNALWKGLGYYSRASRLLAGAQKAVKEYGGKLPDNARDMQANIPGIGRYSAGAICSIAYGEKVPVLDGNVHRLLSRFLAVHASPKAKSTLDILWAAAEAMVNFDTNSTSEGSSQSYPPNTSPQYSGDINQALIELGSTVCKVRDPNCEACPLRTWCAARQNDVMANQGNGESKQIVDIEDLCGICESLSTYEGVTSYPMKVTRKKPREELDVVNVIEWHKPSEPEKRYFLMIRRPEGGLLAGLYEFPTSVNLPKTIKRADQEKIPLDLVSKLTDGGATISKITPIGDVLHVFSHIKKIYRVQWVILTGGLKPPKFLPDPLIDEQTSTKKPIKGKLTPKLVNLDIQLDFPRDAIWVPLNEVMETNMGSGVVKVWMLTKERWENPE